MVGTSRAALVRKTFTIGETVLGANPLMERLGSAAQGPDGGYAVGWATTEVPQPNVLTRQRPMVSRISKSGELLDPHGIPFPSGKAVPGYIEGSETWVAFDGTNYRVGVMSDGAFQGDEHTVLARLSPDGHFLDTTDEQLVDVPGWGFTCLTNGNCVTVQSVTLEDGSAELAFVRIDKDNARVDAPGAEPRVAIEDGCFPALFPAGNQVAALSRCSDSAQAQLTFFDPVTAKLSQPVAVGDLTQEPTSIIGAGRDGEALLLWSVATWHESSYRCALWTQRFSTTGAKLDLEPRQLATDQCERELRTAGEGYLLATNNAETGDSRVHRLDAQGEEVAAFAIGQHQDRVSIAADGNNLLLAAQSYGLSEFSDEQLYFSVLENSGTALTAPRHIFETPNRMSSPAVAWGGDHYLAVWSDTRNGPAPQVYGARITSSGTVLDNPALPLVLDGGATIRSALASSGNGYLLAEIFQTDLNEWPTPKMGLRVTFIDKDGKAGKPVTLVSSLDFNGPRVIWANGPRVIWDGHHYVVGWLDQVARFTDDGTALDGNGVVLPVPWESPPSKMYAPALAATPDGFMAAWHQYTPNVGEHAAAWFEDGQEKVLPVHGPTLISRYETTSELSAACSPKVCAVVWAHRELQLVDMVGQVVGEPHELPLSLSHPVITWDGQAFLLTSASEENVAQYIGEDGEPLAETRTKLTSSESLEYAAAASDGNGHSLVVTGMGDDSRLIGVLLDAKPQGEGGEGGAAGSDGGGTGGDGGSSASAGSGGASAGTGGSVVSGGSGGIEAAGTSNAGTATTAGGTDSEAGAPSQAGEPAVDSPKKGGDSSGCGCRVTPSQSSKAPLALLAALALLVRRRSLTSGRR